MKNECSIVGDLLPLYAESLLSEESAEFVRSHLNDCQACQSEYNNMSVPPTPMNATKDTNIAPLKLIKKQLTIKKVQAIILTASLTLALMLSVFGFLTTPKYYPYSSDLLDVTAVDNGAVIVSFDEKVTDYRIIHGAVPIPMGEEQTYYIEAWTTVWDTLFQKRGRQYAVIGSNNSDPVLIYYVQNYQNGTSYAEDVLIYGGPSITGDNSITLPYLFPIHLLTWACMLLVICIIASAILWKQKKVRLWLERVALFPLAYVIGHICVLQFRTTSYYGERDLFLIILIAILIYCAMLVALNLYYVKKEKKKTEARNTNLD